MCIPELKLGLAQHPEVCLCTSFPEAFSQYLRALVHLACTIFVYVNTSFSGLLPIRVGSNRKLVVATLRLCNDYTPACNCELTIRGSIQQARPHQRPQCILREICASRGRWDVHARMLHHGRVHSSKAVVNDPSSAGKPQNIFCRPSVQY